MFNFFKRKNSTANTVSDAETDEIKTITLEVPTTSRLVDPLHPFDGDEELKRDYIILNTDNYNPDPVLNGIMAARTDLKNHIKDYCLAAHILEASRDAYLLNEARPLIEKIDSLIQFKLIPMLVEQIMDENSASAYTTNYKCDRANCGRDYLSVNNMYFCDYATFKAFGANTPLYLYTHRDEEEMRSNNCSKALDTLRETEAAVSRYLSADPFDVFLEKVYLGNSGIYYRKEAELAEKILLCVNRHSVESFFSVSPANNSVSSAEGVLAANKGELEPYFISFISDLADLRFGISSDGYSLGNTMIDRINVRFRTRLDNNKQIVLDSFRIDLLRNNKTIYYCYIFADNRIPACQRISALLRERASRS